MINGDLKRKKIVEDMLDTNWYLKQTMEVQHLTPEELVELKICDLLRLELKTNWVDKMKESFLVKYDVTDMCDMGVYQLNYPKNDKSIFYYCDGEKVEPIQPNEVFELLFAVERDYTIQKLLRDYE
jgi:hypothetical protein